MSLRRVVPVFLLAFAVCAEAVGQTPNEPPSSWSKVVTLELVAPQNNKSGHPWDGGLDPFLCIPGSPLCGGTARVGGAPDMLLTIIDVDGNAFDYQREPPSGSSNRNVLRTMILNPAEIYSRSRCPEASVCSYPAIRVPDSAFGIIVLDQDVTENDFMLAGIVYEPNKADDVVLDRLEQHVHAFLDNLKQQGKLAGAPVDDELAIRASNDCSAKVCFLDELAGVAGMRLSLTPPVTRGVPCAEATISGSLEWKTVQDGVELRFEPSANACRGTLEFEWDFGDDEESTTNDAAVHHRYDRVGDFEVSVTATCAQRTRSCQAKPLTRTIQVR